MIDHRVLKHFGTTNSQLRQFFTAKGAGKDATGAETPAHELREKRTKFEEYVASLIEDGRKQCFRHYRHFASVDMMMDSAPIMPENVPLTAYAQGKINIETVKGELKGLNCADEFIESKNCAKEGEPESIKTTVNVARLQEVCVNVGRSFIARRANAQNNKYDSLRPFFKYESRGTTMEDKLRGEAMSQYAEIMVDNYGHRHEHGQAVHAMFCYRTVVFPAGAWDTDTQTHVVPTGGQEVEVEGQKLRFATVVEREGFRMVRPNPARVIYDTSQPLSSINTDTGVRWVGFFDVKRFGDISRSSDFFNTQEISWTAAGASVIDQNRAYFDIVFPGTPMNFPTAAAVTGATSATVQVDLAANNERAGNSFLYSQDIHSEKAVFVTDIRIKVTPKEWGMGGYMHPIWLRLLVANDRTVIYAEWLPSLPAVYFGHNEDDTRLMNISTAHEIMPWQDQLSNIFSQLLMKMKHALFRVILINTDIIPKAIADELRKKLDSPSYYINPHLLELSFNEKQKELGFDLNHAIKILGAGEGTNANESEYINNAFKAIIQILAIMERLLNMSPQEQGQPAPREITAEEVAAIESTTQATYNAIGGAIDKARAAWKRIIYESSMTHASDQVFLPVSQRFSKETIENAGFKVQTSATKSSAKLGHTIIGTKTMLVHSYVFSSRDGGDRASNREAANTLTQFLVGILPQIGPEALGKKRIFDITNEIFRLLSSYDLKLELDEGESDAIMAPEMEAKFEELKAALQEHEQEIGGLSDALEKITAFIKETAQPQQPAPPAP